MIASSVHLNRCFDRLEETLLVNTGKDEACLVQGLRPLGAGSDADGREGMPDAGEERGLFRQSAAVRNHGEGVHLKAIVVVEAQRLVANDARIELEAARLQPLPGARVAGVQDGHIVFGGHLIDGVEEREEVLLGVDILLAVSGEEDILTFFETQTLVNVAGLNLGQVVVQHFCHRGAGDVGALFGEAGVGEVTAGVLAVGHVHVRDDVHDAAVGLLGQAFVLATVAGFHVEDRDMETLGADDGEAGVGVAQNEHGVRLHLYHELVALGDDIAHGLTQVVAYGFHVHVRVGELEVLEEDAVEVVVVVLPGVCQQAVEILAAFVDDCSLLPPDSLKVVMVTSPSSTS